MNDAEIFLEQIGPQIVIGDGSVHQRDDLRNARERDSAVVIPFRKRLRRDVQRVRKRDLRTETPIAAGEDAANARADDHSRAFYICALIWSISGLIDAKVSPCQNKPMVYRSRLTNLTKVPDPALYKAFQVWITTLCESEYGAAAVIARYAGVTHPAVKAWCSGVIPQAETLKTLAANMKHPLVTYEKLQALADAGSQAQHDSERQLDVAEFERTSKYAHCWKLLAARPDLQEIAIRQLQALCDLAQPHPAQDAQREERAQPTATKQKTTKRG